MDAQRACLTDWLELNPCFVRTAVLLRSKGCAVAAVLKISVGKAAPLIPGWISALDVASGNKSPASRRGWLSITLQPVSGKIPVPRPGLVMPCGHQAAGDPDRQATSPRAIGGGAGLWHDRVRPHRRSSASNCIARGSWPRRCYRRRAVSWWYLANGVGATLFNLAQGVLELFFASGFQC